MKDKTAILIVDVQVALFAREKFDGKKIYNAEQLLKNIQTLTQKARAANIPIVYLQYTGSDDSLMGKGKPLWEIHPQIKSQEHDIVICKSHADSFYNTTLHEKLQSMNITKLIIMGLQTEYCVDTTCRRAFSLGYKTILVSDGHSTYDTDVFLASQIIEHHNGVIGGKDPNAEKFAELRKTEVIEF
ncbi:MAG: cysteine hydrolase family protein [Dehalococcoidia bacterium]